MKIWTNDKGDVYFTPENVSHHVGYSTITQAESALRARGFRPLAGESIVIGDARTNPRVLADEKRIQVVKLRHPLTTEAKLANVIKHVGQLEQKIEKLMEELDHDG